MAKIELLQVDRDSPHPDCAEWVEVMGEPSVAEVQAWLEERGYTVIGPDGPNYEAAAEVFGRGFDSPHVGNMAGATAVVDAALERTNEDGAPGSMSTDIDPGGDE